MREWRGRNDQKEEKGKRRKEEKNQEQQRQVIRERRKGMMGDKVNKEKNEIVHGSKSTSKSTDTCVCL